MIRHRAKDSLAFHTCRGLSMTLNIWNDLPAWIIFLLWGKKKIFKEMKSIWEILQNAEGQKSKFPSFR